MMEKWLNLPEDVSSHGAGIDELVVWLHWLMLVLFVGWGLFYIISLIKFRAGKNPKADYRGVKNHYSSYIEVAVAILEVILLVGFSIPIWANAVDNFPEEKEAVVVKVLAEQFAWNFHYAGTDGKFGKTDTKFMDSATNPLGLDPNDEAAKDDLHTINKMYVPKDKFVIAKIASKDVIHSFGVLNLRVKQDAIPGMEIPLWFKATKEGNFEIACSQLCGLGHYRMRAEVVVKSEQGYNDWFTEESKAKSEEGSADSFWD